MHAAPYAYPAPRSWNPWAYHNPNRAWWIVGGILVAGGALATTAFVLARREAKASEPQPAPTEVVGPESAIGPEGLGQFPQGAAPAQAELYYNAARSKIRRLTFQFLDVAARDKGIQEGWRAPRRPTDGLGFDPTAEPVDPTTAFAQRQLPPAKGPEHWSQADAWEIATKIYNGIFEELEPYDDIVVWAEIVAPDGPVDAWLKGMIASELMRLTEADPEPVDGIEIDWNMFAVP